ncbi:MAG: hypothetical protein HYX97_04115, partial [Chloroflexi bacterium]|nr:hypothetical protein [Chloroflexota bacterium]
MALDLKDIQAELAKFPAPVATEFQRSLRALSHHLSEEEILTWATEGLALAQYSFRSWEAATEFFRASPEAVKRLTIGHIVQWTRLGRSLSEETPVLAAAYFRGSPAALEHLTPENLPAWVKLGKGLYKGTWKSGSLAAAFFETSPRILRHLTIDELARFARLLDSLSTRSHDLAGECLALADQVFTRLEKGDRLLFLGLAAALAEGNWRDVRPLFDAAPKALFRVQRDQRHRFIALAEKLARLDPSNVLDFFVEGSLVLGDLTTADQAAVLEQAEELASVSPTAVVDLARSVPKALQRIKPDQLHLWVQDGIRILTENPESGAAYFKLESARAERALESISSGLELQKVQDILQMYCQALAGKPVQIHPSETLKERGIGWNSEESPTTEGTAVYLPGFIDRQTSKEANFAWCKVMSTHQVGHLEFGSFDFAFDKPSTLFEKSRRPGLNPPQNGGHGPLTDLQRFFDAFKERRLAADIFMLVEDGRIDFLIKQEYGGIRSAYRDIQAEALAARPPIGSLPMREALVELLVRASLQPDDRSITMPNTIAREGKQALALARTVLNATATVEDTAEAVIRIYDIISKVPNAQAKPSGKQGDLSQNKAPTEQQQAESSVDNAGEGDESVSGSADARGERPYKSPPKVDYRGEFKPELVQLLSQLRKQRDGQSGRSAAQQQISAEALKSLLEKSVEVDIDQGQSTDAQAQAATFVEKLLEQGKKRQAQEIQSGMGDQFRHVEEEGQGLQADDALTFLYDEWDFRAMDFKPRWCSVKERRMEEGSTEFFERTLERNGVLTAQIRRQFELLQPEMFRKVKRLPDGEEFDFDLVVDSVIQRKAGAQPNDKVYWRRNKVERDVAVAFLLDMSASTAEAIDDGRKGPDRWDMPDDPRDYMNWLRNRREDVRQRGYKRIIDIEKESVVLLIYALEGIGDRYGIYGFSGYGRENVEFYVIKDIQEGFSPRVKGRIDKIAPLHATRMGPAIRHVITKLGQAEAKRKLLFLLSDGRPQDRGYS